MSAKNEESVRFSDSVNDFITAHRKMFLIIGLGIAACVLGLGIYSVVARSRLNASTIALEHLEASYAALKEVAETDKKAKQDELITEADTVVSKYGRLYAGGKAMLIKGEILASAGDYALAEKTFAALADKQKKSFLAPVALLNASVMAENNGNQEGALTHLRLFENTYPEHYAIDKVIFSMARIYETLKQSDNAITTYEKLTMRGTDNDWTKLARSRLIALRGGKN